MIEFSVLNGKHHKGIPGAGILQIGFGKVSVAIRMRMKDADQVETPARAAWSAASKSSGFSS